MIVLDASVAGALLMPDEDDHLDLVAKLQVDDFLVPAHFAAELASLCVKGFRRGRVADDNKAQTLASADRLIGLVRIVQPSVAAVVTLAMRHGLSAYDAAYLQLALQERCRLLSNDGPLGRVAQRLGCAA